MGDRDSWGKLFTTVQGGGKFLGVSDGYDCKGQGCQDTSIWPENSHGLKMIDFDRSMFKDSSYQFTMDPATQRPTVSYKNSFNNTSTYGMDFASVHNDARTMWSIDAPYVTLPTNYKTPNFNTERTRVSGGVARNFNGYRQDSSYYGLNAGLCYNPSSLEYPISVGSDGQFPGNVWPVASNTPGCNWIDFNTVYGCCAELGFADNNPACSASPSGYSQNGSSPCQNVMLQMCEDNWTQDACAKYLQAYENGLGIKDVAAVFQKAITNYINKMAERTGCGTNDYTSPKLGSCTMTKGPNAGQLRDDSTDTFLNGTMLNFCSINAPQGVCDNILNQYCSEFTREDLIADPALQKICGCHMSTGSSLPAPTPGTTPLKLGDPPDYKTKRQGNQYLYPVVGVPCDPICAHAGTVQSAAPPCAATICIMDNAAITLVNSSCENSVSISQVCGPNYDGSSGTGYCYMSESDINLINSTCGNAYISQNCNSCFAFDPEDSSNAYPVDCKNPSGNPIPGGGSGGGRGGSSSNSTWSKITKWIGNNKIVAGGITLTILIFIILIIIMASTSGEAEYMDS